MAFLPVTKDEMNQLGWQQPDFVLVTGDAYVDHPSFGAAIISRLLEKLGYHVCILAQPEWRNDKDFLRFGRPTLGFLVTSGNIDSMVAHYTAAKRKRSDDAYSPGGKAGYRPDRAVSVYCGCIRRVYGDIPIVIGGLEASLRRFAHYDYWADDVYPSLLEESGADMLVYGMGERQMAGIADCMAKRMPISQLQGICRMANVPPDDAIVLPGFEKICQDKKAFTDAFRIEHQNQSRVGKTLAQKQKHRWLVQNPPADPLERAELDEVYALPFMRAVHPMYEAMGGVPGLEEVEFSIAHNRGCFGDCNFCALTFHQGREVTSRSAESVVTEAEEMTKNPRFKGYIHDVGGPTANFRNASCGKQKETGFCTHKCLAPSPCKNLIVDHSEYLDILRKLRKLPGVKKVFIRSGIRYDYLMADKDESFFKELVQHHVSGQLKVAPEHVSNEVLAQMGKPSVKVYQAFSKRFYELTKSADKKQYLVPYLISSHPGSRIGDAIELALYLKHNNIRPEQVQDFYPTPGTASTCMFYTGINPFTGKAVTVPKSPEEKAEQRLLLQYYKPENADKVRWILQKAGRDDLIGYGAEALIAPGQNPTGGPVKERVRTLNLPPPKKAGKRTEKTHTPKGKGEWHDRKKNKS